MNNLAERMADGAIGTVTPAQLTDEFILGKQPIIEYIQSDDVLQFLFVNHEQGLNVAKLVNPDDANDFSAGDSIEKAPVGNYAAVMAITSTCIHYIIGRAEKDEWFTVDFEDISAVRSENTNNGLGITIRKGGMKFLFIPEDPDEVDSAVNYLILNIKGDTSVQTESTTNKNQSTEASSTSKQEFKYSTSSSRVTDTDQQPGGSDNSSVSTEADESRDTVTHTTELSKSSKSGSQARQRRDKSTTAEDVTSKSTESGGESTNTDDHTIAPEKETQKEETQSADAVPSGLPATVKSHLAASREALEGIDSPFIQPAESYTATIAAYEKLCQALEALPAEKFPEEHQRITSKIDDAEVLIESLSEYGSILKRAQTLIGQSGEDGSSGEPAIEIEPLKKHLKQLQKEVADTSVDTSPIEKLVMDLEEEYEPSGMSHPTEMDPDHIVEKPEANRSDPKTTSGDQDTGETIEEPSEAPVETPELNSESDVVPTLLLHLKDQYDETDGTVIFNAFDPVGNQIQLVVEDEFEDELRSGHYYRFNNIKSTHNPNSGLSQVTVTTNSSIKDSVDSKLFVDPGPSNATQSPAITRQERVADQLLIANQEQLTTEAGTRLRTIGQRIHELDIHEVDIQTGLNRLAELDTDLNAINAETTGVESGRLGNIRTRVSKQLQKFEEIKNTLITAQRKISIAKTSDTVPGQDLHDVDEDLQAAISHSKALERDTTHLETLKQDIEELLEDSLTSETDRNSDSDSDERTDTGTDIQPNEVSEYYDVLRNLKRLTSIVQAAIDDLDEPMEQWCDTVNAFHLGEVEDYACYGKLQSDLNEFSMSEYRDVYGDGDRTTDFHIIDTEPLTSTVEGLIGNTVSDQTVTDVGLPVAPESETRLPVIVETDTELDSAVSLLKELPKTPSQSASMNGPPGPVKDGPDTGDTSDTPENKNEAGSPNDQGVLTEIGGVTEDVAAALQKEGITTRSQLIEIDLDELTAIDGISSGIAQRIKMQVG